MLQKYLRKVHPAFFSMSITSSHQLLHPTSKLYTRARRGGPDMLMLIDSIMALIELYHADEELAQSTIVMNREILHSQERMQR